MGCLLFNLTVINYIKIYLNVPILLISFAFFHIDNVRTFVNFVNGVSLVEENVEFADLNISF